MPQCICVVVKEYSLEPLKAKLAIYVSLETIEICSFSLKTSVSSSAIQRIRWSE